MKRYLLLMIGLAFSCQSKPESRLKDVNEASRTLPRFVKFLRNAEPRYVGLFPQLPHGTQAIPDVAISLNCTQQEAAAMLGLSPQQQAELLSEEDLIQNNGLNSLPALRCGRPDPAPAWPQLGPVWWSEQEGRYLASIQPKVYLSVPIACAEQVFATGLQALADAGIAEDHFGVPGDKAREIRLNCGRGALEPVLERRPWKIFRNEASLVVPGEEESGNDTRFVAVHTSPGGAARVLTILSLDGFTYKQIINGRRKRPDGTFTQPGGAKFEALYNDLYRRFGDRNVPLLPDRAPVSYFEKAQTKQAPELFVNLCLSACARSDASPGPWIRKTDSTEEPLPDLIALAAHARETINVRGAQSAQLLPTWNFPACASQTAADGSELSFLDALGIQVDKDTRSFTKRLKEAQRAPFDGQEWIACPQAARCVVELPEGGVLQSSHFTRPQFCDAGARVLELRIQDKALIEREPLLLDARHGEGFDEVIIVGVRPASRIAVNLDCSNLADPSPCWTGEALAAVAVRQGRRLTLRNITLEPLPGMLSGQKAAPWGVRAFEVADANSILVHDNVEVTSCQTSAACSFDEGIVARDGAQFFNVNGSIKARLRALAFYQAQGSLTSSAPTSSRPVVYAAPARTDERPVGASLRSLSVEGNSEVVLRGVELAAPHPLFVYESDVDGAELKFSHPFEAIGDKSAAIDLFERGRISLFSPQIKGFEWIARFDAFADSEASRLDRRLDLRSPINTSIRDSVHPVVFFADSWYCVQPGPVCQ